MQPEEMAKKLLETIGNSMMPYDTADKIIAKVKTGDPDTRDKVMLMLLAYLNDGVIKKSKVNEVFTEAKDSLESLGQEDLRGVLLNLDPAGDTGDLRKKEVFAVFEVIGLNDQSMLLLITAFGIRIAPTSENNIARLRSLGFSIVHASLRNMKRETKEFADALEITEKEITDEDVERLEAKRLDRILIWAKDINGAECFFTLFEGTLWCFDISQENQDQFTAWNFYIEALKYKPDGPTLK